MQYVFQDARAAFDEHRPVLDQVARTAVRLRGLAKADAQAGALTTLPGLGLGEDLVRRRLGLGEDLVRRRLGLGEDLVRRRPGRLPGCELQRAALARACRPGRVC
ncbi:hypothetical protein ACIQ1J_31240 [Streptomyces sp. NPDC097107]|uniref:hypothetical protein n=1 Tax=Streptomyces sp. NPDC097107 TaxID=3366089 RepID=UPI0038303C1F